MSKNAIQTLIIIVRKNKRGLSKGTKIVSGYFCFGNFKDLLPSSNAFSDFCSFTHSFAQLFFLIELAVLQFTIGPNFILIKRITIEKILSDDCVLDIHANTLISIRKTKKKRTEDRGSDNPGRGTNYQLNIS